MVENTVGHHNLLISKTANSTEHELLEQATQIQRFIDQSRSHTQAAHKEANQLMEEEGCETSENIADWKANRNTSKLHARADRSERCALTAIEIAALTMDEAERVHRALLTRKETVSI
jgi:predicted metal-dependent hydrolase